MSDEKKLTRRETTMAVAGLAGAAAVGGAVTLAPKQQAARARQETPMNPHRMPMAFVPHGGGPWPFVDLGFGPKDQENRLRGYLEGLSSVPRTKPKALLVI